MAEADMACFVDLTKGLRAIVSPEDFERVAAFRWAAAQGGHTTYAYRTVRFKASRQRQSGLKMHRFILDAPKGYVVDHINGDGLDNRRPNLRLCSHAENIRNQVRQHGSKHSRFKGVWLGGSNWRALIQFEGKKIGLGSHPSEEAAARAYDAAATRLFGEFARTNAAQGLF